MSSIIYLVRHAESEHNVSKDFNDEIRLSLLPAWPKRRL